jgi:transposase-like protein
MHTSNLEIQMLQAGRRRGRYSDDFKRQVVTTCLEPGVSTAAVALANGLNANLLRRWVVEATLRSGSPRSKTTALAPVHNHPTFIPVKFDPPAPAASAPPADIRLELQHGATTVHTHWPLQASSQCAQWLREVLA